MKKPYLNYLIPVEFAYLLSTIPYSLDEPMVSNYLKEMSL